MGYRDLVLAARPVGYWRPGDVPPGVPSGTTIRDQTGRGNVGTTISSAYQRGPALYTCGSLDTRPAAPNAVDRISVSWPSAPLSRFSFEAVASFASFASTPTLIAQDDGSTRTFQWRVEASGLLNLFYWDASGQIRANTDATALTVGVRHHIVSTASGSAIAHYVDGQLRSSVPVASSMRPPSGLITVANRGNFTWQPFRGLMSDLAIYDRVLSLDDVKSHWHALSTAPAPTRRPLHH